MKQVIQELVNLFANQLRNNTRVLVVELVDQQGEQKKAAHMRIDYVDIFTTAEETEYFIS